MPEPLPVELVQSDTFARWLESLRDRQALARILARLESLRAGHAGDMKAVGGGVLELRVHIGPGYRIYCTRVGGRLIVLLCGGDKTSQRRDIVEAKALAAEARKEFDGKV